MLRRYFIKFPLLASLVVTNSATAFSLDGTIFKAVGDKYEIDPLLLYSVALAESAKGAGTGLVSPTPYVFRNDKGPRYFNTLEEAQKALSVELKRTKWIDIGMMQTNLGYHPHPQPLSLLKADVSLDFAAKYLKTTLSSTKDPILGIGRYHSWTPERANWYGRYVQKIYNNILKIK